MIYAVGVSLLIMHQSFIYLVTYMFGVVNTIFQLGFQQFGSLNFLIHKHKFSAINSSLGH